MATGPGTTRRRSARPPRALRLSELLTLKDHTDATGRLLLEDSAPERARARAERAGVAMHAVECPYDDTPSRRGGLMNVSAYEALRRDLGEVLDGFAWLATNYVAPDATRAGRVATLVAVAKVGTTLPLVLFNKAVEPIPVHGRLPSYIASIFKASRGVFSAAVDMYNRMGETVTTTGAGAVAFAERNHHLVRTETGRACAAPTKLIERTIDVMLTGRGADARKSTLEQLVVFEMLWEFHELEESLSDACSKYKYVFDRVVERGGGTNPAALFGVGFDDGTGRWTFGELTESFVRHLNIVQIRLNRVLGRDDDVRPVTFEDAIKIL